MPDLMMPEGSDPWYGQRYMPSQGVSAYHPTWRDQTAQFLQNPVTRIKRLFGYDDQDRAPSPERGLLVAGLTGSRGQGETGFGLLDVTPAGIPLGVNDAWHKGDDRSLAMALIPGAPKAAGAVENAAAKGIRAYHGSPDPNFNPSQSTKPIWLDPEDGGALASGFGKVQAVDVDPTGYLKVKSGGLLEKIDDKFGSGRAVEGKANLVAPVAKALGYKGIDYEYLPRDGQRVLMALDPSTVKSVPQEPPGIRAYHGSPEDVWHHGTRNNFDAFRLPEKDSPDRVNGGWKGVSFTQNKAEAGEYAGHGVTYRKRDEPLYIPETGLYSHVEEVPHTNPNGRVIDANLRVSNPYQIQLDDAMKLGDRYGFSEDIARRGHDAIDVMNGDKIAERVMLDLNLIDIVKKYGIAAAASMYGMDAVNQAMGAAMLPPDSKRDLMSQ